MVSAQKVVKSLKCYKMFDLGPFQLIVRKQMQVNCRIGSK
jgi:hypothetical protein